MKTIQGGQIRTKTYKMKPNTTIYKGDQLWLKDGMVETIRTYGNMPPSQFMKLVENGGIDTSLPQVQHNIRFYSAILGSDDFIGVAAEYKKNGEDIEVYFEDAIIYIQKDEAEDVKGGTFKITSAVKEPAITEPVTVKFVMRGEDGKY